MFCLRMLRVSVKVLVATQSSGSFTKLSLQQPKCQGVPEGKNVIAHFWFQKVTY